MKVARATSIAKLIEAHRNGDEKMFYAYANFIAEAYEDAGDTLSAKIIRMRINNVQGEKVCLDGVME